MENNLKKRDIIVGLTIFSVATLFLFIVSAFTPGNYNNDTPSQTTNNTQSPSIKDVDKILEQSTPGTYYGSVGYRQKLTSGRDNDIIVLAKFSNYADCNLWLSGRKKDNTVVESICESSEKPDTVYLEKIIQLNSGDRTYLSFIDTTGISVRVMPLSGSSEDSTIVALVLKKQIESSGINNIKVIYRLK